MMAMTSPILTCFDECYRGSDGTAIVAYGFPGTQFGLGRICGNQPDQNEEKFCAFGESWVTVKTAYRAKGARAFSRGAPE